MCVIAAKPAGVEMPGEEYLQNMWINNDDGAGLMYANKGKVYIEKGFMKYPDFIGRLNELQSSLDFKKLPVVMHFRITTHGGTKPENCHPFPITDSVGMLKKRKSTAKLGVAHNGIIPIHPQKGISDTMEYIASQIAPLSKAVPDFYRNKHLMQMIENATDGSRLAFLNSKGEIYTIGKFIKADGVMYSNDSFETIWKWRSFHGCYSTGNIWDDYDDEEYLGSDVNYDYYNKVLMWLDDDDNFVIDPAGSYVNGDFAIDAQHKVYGWSSDAGAMVLLPGFRAYTFDGKSLTFNIDSDMISTETVADEGYPIKRKE